MVYFVGAGPGAVDLITVRGQKLLEQADIVVYAGSLVNPALLDSCREDCIIHDSAGMTLEEVMEILVAGVRQGNMVVRLHTGDPSLYGAIREQMDCLNEEEIPYEVVPGVSSFGAAAAAIKAEYTLPGVSQSLIITRVAGRTPVPEREEIASFAAHGASMAVFLSAGLLDKLSRQLIAGGYAPDTPAAIVYKASWPEEQVYHTTVGELYQTGSQAGITETALILVGDFLGDKYQRSQLYNPAFGHKFREGSE